jgi:hypothetical protein
MPDSQLRELTRSAAYRILMALGTRSPVVHGTETGAHVVLRLVEPLIEHEGVARRFGNPVTQALGTGILDEGWRVKA